VSASNLVPGKNTGLPLAESKYVKIAIKDPGTGIPAEMLKKIFDPYFSTKPKGSGLGLSSAYSIINKHEGYIHVESQPGKGSVFTVYIPASHVESPKPPAREKQKHKEQETIKVEDRGKRILVMDDDRFVGDIAMKMLTHLGYQVEVAVDGNQTIDLYKKSLEKNRPYGAVIMDLTIPGGMGGVEAIKKLLKIDPRVKAIVSSGYSNDPVMADFRQYGFRGFIKKPYLLKELKKILDQVFEE
jgi:CheY-like chemotaxis protein